MIEGIDVSAHQAQTPPLGGLGFMFARASHILETPAGPRAQSDTRYAMHRANGLAAGLIVGAYAFGSARVTVAEQLRVFLLSAGSARLCAYDVEGGDAPTRAQAREMIDGLQNAGKVAGLYHSASGYFDAGQDFDWVAKWGPMPPTRSWDFWQYRGSPLDLDKWRGTMAELAALAGLPPAPDTGGAMILARPNRAVTVSGGHGIFDRPAVNALYLIRNTVEGETLRLIGNDSGFQVVDPDDPGGKPGYVADANVTGFIDLPNVLADNYAERLRKINGLSAI